MMRGADQGFSLVEVLVAMTLSAVVLMGGVTAVQMSGRFAQQGRLAAKALALAQSRVEAKRSVRWEALLLDDLDFDGQIDLVMMDDGQGADLSAGDGIYSARWERDGVTLIWNVAPDRVGPLATAGFVTIRVAASYESLEGTRTVKVGTVRANPAFAGSR
jgi:prepilin-type N-terminal cleavage/methylation domain-containing protein